MLRTIAKPSVGFTLIELMITLTVLVILTLLAVPSFRDYIEKARVRGAADQVTDLLARARIAAVKNSLPVAISASRDSAGVWCMGASMPNPPTTDLESTRSNTALPCDCRTPATAPRCDVDGAAMVLSSSSLSSGTPPDVALTSVAFSYTPKLGGISDNGASSSFLSSAATRQIDITSPNARYTVSVRVTPLGQSYTCVPDGKPVFLGYRTC